MAAALSSALVQSYRMFAQQYEDAFAANPELADAIWEYWDAGLIPDEVAAIAWMQIAMSAFTESGRSASSA